MSTATNPPTGQRPLVSVVMIFFDEAKFIREAIESVLAQAYSNWELLLVDDGSTDESATIALNFARENPGKMRYLEHPGRANRGTAASRNLGIRHAGGRYLTFLDADDVWFPHTLEEQVAILETTPQVAMVYGPLQWWYSWTGKAEDAARDYVEQLGVTADTIIDPPALVPVILEDKGAVPSGFLVRRETLQAVGEIDESFRTEYEDQVLCVKICLREAVFAASRVWYRYRQHPESCVAVGMRTAETGRWRLAFLRWVRRYLYEQHIDDRGVRSAVRRELRRLRRPVLHDAVLRLRRVLWRAARALGRMSPVVVRRWVGARIEGRAYVPAVGGVRFGSLRRVTPISRRFGYDRGEPIDRYYIERFLDAHGSDIKGRVIEIGGDVYTRRFGGPGVTASDVLDIDPKNPKATLVGDLTKPPTLPQDAFDCFIVTQTLLFIYDVRAALETIYRSLKPGGVMLATVPGISQISRYEMNITGDFWRFTTRSAQRLCEEVFGAGNVEVAAHGNVLAASAFLFGLASRELTPAELDVTDPDYQMLITIRATKYASSGPA